MTTAAADLNRTKMTATQAVMRNATLSESDKRRRIQTIQKLARDAGMDDETKIARMEEVAAAVAAASGAGGGVGKGDGADNHETDASSDTGSTDERSSSAASSNGSADDSSSSSVSSADVGKAKMKATQDIMRNTALNQAEKPGLIRKVQAVAADDSLSNGVKVRRIQNLAEGKEEKEEEEEEGGSNTSDEESDADSNLSDSDVAKAKMKATQDIMRNTTLNQAEKPQLIRKVQAVASDSALSNGAKVKQMQQLAEGKDASASSPSSSPSPPSSPPKDVSDADVNKAKMEATQKIMRDTALNQAEKPKMIRDVQAICSDGSLDNSTKVDRIQEILNKAGGAASSPSSSGAVDSSDVVKKSAAPDVGEEKEAEDDDDDDDDAEPVENVDLTAFKSEVIQGLIKNKSIPGEEKQAKIRAAHAVVLNRTYDDFEKIRRLRKIQKGKDVVEPIGESVFAPLPEAGAMTAAPEEAPAPTAGHGTADERLRAKMSGGAGGGAQAGVSTNSTANDRLRAKMQGGAAAGAAAGGGAAPGVSVGSTANDRLRAKMQGGGSAAPAPAAPGVSMGSTANDRLRAKMQGGGAAAAAPAPAAPGISMGSTANDRLRAKMQQGQGGAAGPAPVAPGVSMGGNSTANDRLRAKMQQGAGGGAAAAPAPAAPGVTMGSTANDRLRAKMQGGGAAAGAATAAAAPAAPGVTIGGNSTANDRLRAKMQQGAGGGASAPAPAAPGVTIGGNSTANDRLRAKMNQGASGVAAAPTPAAPGVSMGSSANDRLKAKMQQGASAGGAAPQPAAPGVSMGSSANDRLKAKMQQGASAAGGAAAAQAPAAPGVSMGSSANDRLKAKMQQGASAGGAAPQPAAPGVSMGSSAKDRLKAKMQQGASAAGGAAAAQAPAAPGVSMGSSANDRLKAKMQQGASAAGGAAPQPAAPGVSMGSSANDRLKAKMQQGATAGAAGAAAAQAPAAPGVSMGSTANDRLKAKMNQGASANTAATAPQPAGPGVSMGSTANDRLKAKMNQGASGAQAPAAPGVTSGSTANDRLKAKMNQGATEGSGAAPGVSAGATANDRLKAKMQGGASSASQNASAEDRIKAKMQGNNETAGAAIGAAAAGGAVMAAAANQTGMPDVVAGVENTPESTINEKAASGLSMSMNEKLGQGSKISTKTKQEQGKSSTTADQSLRDLDNRVDRKMQDGTLEGLNDSDKLAYNGKKDEMDRRKSIESDKVEKGDGKDFDDGRTDTDLTDLGDPGDLDEWLAGEVLPAEVAVDEGGALQATLALEEELKQAVNAGAIKTLQEVEAEELEEALKEEDSRLKKYWKKFTVFGIIVAIVVGVSAGLTRGKAKNLTFMELEDICNYTNTRAPWLRSAELRDEEKEFLDIQFKDGTFAPILRGFATSVSMSYDGTRAAVAGRFGDEFHVFERDTEENFTKAEWKLVGGIIPMLHSHMADKYEELEEHQSDVALSGDGTVVACGYPYYRTDEEYDGKYEKWGAVAVYRIGKSGEWELMGEPFYGEGPRDYLGQAVALSEDGTVVAFGEFRNTFRTGRITVHKWNGEEWTTIGIIPGKDSGEQLGGEISLSRDGTIVAASAQYGGDDGNGEARVYQMVGGTGDPTSDWVQMGTDIVAAPGYPYFGWPVSLSGNGTRLATASASFESDGDIEGGLDAGTVWVFEYNPNTADWEVLGDPIDGATGGDGLGWGLALSADGRTVAAGAPNSDTYLSEAGYVAVFRYLCGNWTQMGKDIEGLKPDSWTGLTVSVSENGEYLAAGSPYDYSGEIGKPGYVRLFESPFDFDYIDLRTDDYGIPTNDTVKLIKGSLPEGGAGNKILEAALAGKSTVNVRGKMLRRRMNTRYELSYERER